jgi:hypothetical protein
MDAPYDPNADNQVWSGMCAMWSGHLLMKAVEIKETLSAPCATCEEIDDALRSYLAAATAAKGLLVNRFWATADGRSGSSASGGVYCTLCVRITCIQHIRRSRRLREAAVCLCIITSIATASPYGGRADSRQEEDPDVLYLVAAFLMFDGKGNEPTFEMMQEEGIFPRLLELIEEWNAGKSPLLQRMLLILLYEMARMQRLTREDLGNSNHPSRNKTKGG